MHSELIPIPDKCDVAVVGGGPSGLAVATQLRKLGIESVLVLERETQAGGIPRHCGHSPFGMREFNRVYSGTTYTHKLVERAENFGVQICLQTSVIAIEIRGKLILSTVNGQQTLNAKRVVLCTGNRETPRANRFISGMRPMGIVTTGAMQSTAYLAHKMLFNNPIVVGTELVSFSALMSCRHMGVRPVAMLESQASISSTFGTQLIAKALKVPIYYQTKLKRILGKRKVRGVEVKLANGEIKNIECDGVIFSGEFTAETSLMTMGHLDVDPNTNLPIIDQFSRCSDSAYFATGNVTHPVETAGYCWQDGVNLASKVRASLQGKLDVYNQRVNITYDESIKYVVPQKIAVDGKGQRPKEKLALTLRVKNKVKGRLSLYATEQLLARKKIRVKPHQRLSLELPEFTNVQYLQLRVIKSV